MFDKNKNSEETLIKRQTLSFKGENDEYIPVDGNKLDYGVAYRLDYEFNTPV